jgi:hypothetical protein
MIRFLLEERDRDRDFRLMRCIVCSIRNVMR